MLVHLEHRPMIALASGPLGTSPAGALSSAAPAQWVRPGTRVQVAEMQLDCGGFYWGAQLKDAYRHADPSLINPALPVQALPADPALPVRERHPSYSRLTPPQRCTYLQWLQGGRLDPEIDPSYVWIYFYGLERRAVKDGTLLPDAQHDWPAIAAELKRLHRIYFRHSRLAQQLRELHDWIEWARVAKRAPSELLSEWEASTLGMLSGKAEEPGFVQAPIPFDPPCAVLRMAAAEAPGQRIQAWLAWALACNWTRVRLPPLPEGHLDEARAEQAELFMRSWSRAYPEGMRLPGVGAGLRVTYYPASPAFEASTVLTADTGLPDLVRDASLLRALQSTTRDLARTQKLLQATREKVSPHIAFLGLTSPWRWPESLLQEVVREAGPFLGDWAKTLQARGALPAEVSHEVLTSCLGASLHAFGVRIEPAFSLCMALTADCQDQLALPGLDKPLSVTLLARLALSAALGVHPRLGAEELELPTVALWEHFRRTLARSRRFPTWLKELHKPRAGQQASDAGRRLLEGLASEAASQTSPAVPPAAWSVLLQQWEVTLEEVPELARLLSTAVAQPMVQMSELIRPAPLRLDESRIASLQSETQALEQLLDTVFEAEDAPDEVEAPPAEEVTSESAGVSSFAVAESSSSAAVERDEPLTPFGRFFATLTTREKLFLSYWSSRDQHHFVPDGELQTFCEQNGFLLEGILEQLQDKAWDILDEPLWEEGEPLPDGTPGWQWASDFRSALWQLCSNNI